MQNEISFINQDFTYSIKEGKFDVKDSRRLYNTLINNGGLMYICYETNKGISDIRRFYMKCYKLSEERERSFNTGLNRIEIRFCFDYRSEYPKETAFCIELSFLIEDARNFIGYSNICLNILLDKDCKVITIDPCCNYDLIITRFLFSFEIEENRQIISNEI